MLKALGLILQYWFSAKLLDWFLRVTSVEDPARVAVLRGLREQNEYERYCAYCSLEHTKPYDFYRWREVGAWLQDRFKNAEQNNLALKTARQQARWSV